MAGSKSNTKAKPESNTKGKAPAEPRNAEVKALREHSNLFGTHFVKDKGSTYIHPRPAADIAAGVVELVEDAPKG